jgi:HlyD family secretion protein
MKSYIIYQTTIQINTRNDIAVDLGGCDRSTKTTPYRNNGKVDRQQVSIGQHSDLAAEIRQGVKQGDVVILHPTEQIKTGDRVSPR